MENIKEIEELKALRCPPPTGESRKERKHRLDKIRQLEILIADKYFKQLKLFLV